MKDNYKTTTMIAMFAAVMSMGFLPVAIAQTSTLTVNLQPTCGFGITDVNVAIGPVTPPANAVFQVNMTNTGTASLPVSADIGDATTAAFPVGGFADGTRALLTDIHIGPSSVTVNADGAVGAIGNVVMSTNGTLRQIALLGPTGGQGEDNARPTIITAATNNLLNTPAVGVQTATFTFTGGTCA